MADDLKNLFQELEKAKKESVKEEQENLNKTASSLKTTVGVIKQNEISNLFEGLEQASVEADIEIKKKLELNEKEKEKLNDFSVLMEKVGSLSEKTEEENVSQITEVVTEFVEPETVEEEVVEEKKPTTIIDEIVSNLDDMGQRTEVKEQLDEIQSLRKEFEQYKRTLQNQVTKGLATSSGSGEVRLEFLDDVERSTATVNGKFLKYDSSSGLFVGSDVTATAETDTEEVQDIVGAMFSSNTETGITATYQDGDGTIDLVVGTLNQDTTGNAATATTLETARNIGGVSFNGSANINLPGVNTSGTQDTSGNAATATALESARNIGGVSFDGTGNINLPGVNTSGTQDTSGNAATATALATARNIGGVSFDGTGNINLPGVNTSGTQDTSGNAATATALATARTIHGVSFDGTANIDLSEVVQDTVGAMFSSNTETGITVTYQDGDGTIDLVIGTLNQDTTGNAATATALETARTIHGVSFDGSANIDLSEVIQDTVGAMFSSNTETNITATYQDGDGTIDLVVGDTTGNAATATALESARTIHGVSFDGTANIDLSEVIQDTVGAMFSSNTETGITVTYQDADGTIDLVVGTLNQDTTGNADTATALETARTIHGVSFDGTANIDLSEVIQDTVGAMFSSNTETNITVTYQDGDGTIDLVVGDTTGNAATATALETARNIGGVSFDGTANINLPGVNTSGTQDTSGNAATATALATARNIGGVSFDGTGNINLPGVNTSGTQNTSGNAATATALATARAINGVDFDGTGAITVTAAAGTLSGDTLKSTVTASSLTSVGTLSSLSIANGGTIGSAGDSDAITLSTAGNVTLAETVTVSKGIKFPATQVASTDANTLDDYEEGTWTPVVTGTGTAGTYEPDNTFNKGFYQKIGRIVTVRAISALASSITAGGSGSMQIGGLPFNYDVSDNCGSGAVVTDSVDFTDSAISNVNIFGLAITANSGTDASTLRLLLSQDNSGFYTRAIADVDPLDFIEFTYTYATTA